MSKEEKITPEELVELQKFVGNLNQVQMELGKLELQKSQAISAYAEVQKSMSEFQKGLEEITQIEFLSKSTTLDLSHLLKTFVYKLMHLKLMAIK